MKQLHLPRSIALLSLLFVLLFALSPVTVSADAKTFEPTRDTHVDEKLPSSSFGTIGLGTVGYESSSSNSKIVLMHFDVSSIPAGSVISSSKLTVRIGGCTGSAADQGLTSFGGYIANGSPAWSESSTYQQLSTSGSSLDGIGSKLIPCTAGSYVDFDMTELVKAWVDGAIQNDGLYLSPVSGAGNWTRVMYMREATASSRPKLEVTYTIPYETVESPDGGPIDSTGAGTPTKNTSKAYSTSQPINPDVTLMPPTSLAAAQSKDSTAVELSWKKSTSADVESYRIYRRDVDKGVVDSKIGEVAGDIAKFVDKDTKAGTKYSYFLRAVRNKRESPNTDPVIIEVKSKIYASQKSPEALQQSNDRLGRLLLAAVTAVIVASIALILLFIKHRSLHKKHKAVIGKAHQPQKQEQAKE